MKTAEVPAAEVSETAGTAPESLGVGLIAVGITGTMLGILMTRVGFRIGCLHMGK